MEGGGRASQALARQRAKREAEEKAKAEPEEKPDVGTDWSSSGRAYNSLMNQRAGGAEKTPKKPQGNFDIFRTHFVLAHYLINSLFRRRT